MENNILDNQVFELVKTGNKLLPFMKSKSHVLRENGIAVKKETHYFNKTHLPGFMKMLSEQSFSGAKPLEIVSAQGSCYMDVVTTGDRQFAAVQLFEYVPFAFHPVNEMYQLRGKPAEEFLDYLSSSKKAAAR
ncbi:MAG: hypothetical protein LBK07_04125 [Tannerella sp.]|jgi:hypothetical protein|nr:hypothetical protein [Tannerella sp.]